jgi:sulfatase maturation enzyme AslB (radical SAM superfamily)
MNSLARIRSLTVVLTSQCNLRCRYCYQNAKKPRSMDWKTLRGAFDLVLESEDKDVGVGFMGGEPLLEFPLMRRGIEYAERNRPRGKRVKYSVSTNGTLLTEKIVDYLKKRRVKTQLSIDGVEDAQRLRGPGTFPLTDELLERLRKRHRNFYDRHCTVAVIVTPANIRHLADSVDYLLRKGARRISIAPSVVSDSRWRVERIGELDAQFDRILESSLSHLRRTGRTPVQILQGEPEGSAAASAASRKGRPMCGIASGRGLTVDVDGEAYGCNLFVDSYQRFTCRSMRTRVHDMRMGSIGDPAFARRFASFPDAVRRTGMFHRKDAKYSSYSRCKDCGFFSRCSVCPACIAHLSGNSDPNRLSDFSCAFTMAALKCRERFAARRGPKNVLRVPADAVAMRDWWKAVAGSP